MIVNVSGTNLKFSILIEFPEVFAVVVCELFEVCVVAVVVVEVDEQEVIKKMEIIIKKIHRKTLFLFILIDPFFFLHDHKDQ